mmetsp:Transcript_51029/g.84714  ORF Transcript_51029/g.84714 Transcript_51029/m.84714 type:complete len:535 (+) Transcript_51029:40-1644(+)
MDPSEREPLLKRTSVDAAASRGYGRSPRKDRSSLDFGSSSSRRHSWSDVLPSSDSNDSYQMHRPSMYHSQNSVIRERERGKRNSMLLPFPESSPPPLPQNAVSNLQNVDPFFSRPTPVLEEAMESKPSLEAEQIVTSLEVPDSASVSIHVYDYGPDDFNVQRILPIRLPRFLTESRPTDTRVRWIRVDGLDRYTMRVLADAFDLVDSHIADCFHTPQLARADFRESYVFIIANILRHAPDEEANSVSVEQISLFLMSDTLISVCEGIPSRPSAAPSPMPSAFPKMPKRVDSLLLPAPAAAYLRRPESVVSRVSADLLPSPLHGLDAWEAIHDALQNPYLTVRRMGPAVLCCALLDAVVGHSYPLLDTVSGELDDVDKRVLAKASPHLIRRVHGLERDLLLIRRMMIPMREAVVRLVTLPVKENPIITEEALHHFMTLRDNCSQVLSIVDNLLDFGERVRELAGVTLDDSLNRIMTFLTIVGTLFTPATFLATVYGMVFDDIPELHWRYGYPAFWMVVICSTTIMLVFFRRRGWI